MTGPIRDRDAMITGMDPVRQPGIYHFCTFAGVVPDNIRKAARGGFREAEGLSLILSEPDAITAGVSLAQPMACLTLNVLSSLEGVGLTAAVAKVLADAEIPCNVVAAFHHDHLFVPLAMADRALALLRARAAGGNLP